MHGCFGLSTMSIEVLLSIYHHVSSIIRFCAWGRSSADQPIKKWHSFLRAKEGATFNFTPKKRPWRLMFWIVLSGVKPNPQIFGIWETIWNMLIAGAKCMSQFLDLMSSTGATCMRLHQVIQCHKSTTFSVPDMEIRVIDISRVDFRTATYLPCTAEKKEHRHEHHASSLKHAQHKMLVLKQKLGNFRASKRTYRTKQQTIAY